jgi:hypothetical protein
MRFELFTQVALARDVLDKGLRTGDVATIVEHHPVASGEDGYTLEVFDAVGGTLAILTLAESEIEPLRAGEILSVRALTPS